MKPTDESHLKDGERVTGPWSSRWDYEQVPRPHHRHQLSRRQSCDGGVWQPNQQLSIRSIRGSLKSLGRVTQCQPVTDKRFVIGIEIYSPGDWTARDMTKTT